MSNDFDPGHYIAVYHQEKAVVLGLFFIIFLTRHFFYFYFCDNKNEKQFEVLCTFTMLPQICWRKWYFKYYLLLII